MFIVLKEGRSEILRNYIETSREKYITHYYEGRSEINASYFIMLAHDVGGECC